MPRYVAFLRGVSPLNAKMPELKRSFELAGFKDVRSLLSSGNVAFSSRTATEIALARRAERAMEAVLGRTFGAFVRPSTFLLSLLESDPFAEFEFPADAKRVVTFLRAPARLPVAIPPARDQAQILKVAGAEVFSVYVPGPDGPVFMNVLEKAFGSNITTRTLDTVKKCASA
jgi:uncharacterized protein (DUF1697 family)